MKYERGPLQPLIVINKYGELADRCQWDHVIDGYNIDQETFEVFPHYTEVDHEA